MSPLNTEDASRALGFCISTELTTTRDSAGRRTTTTTQAVVAFDIELAPEDVIELPPEES